VQVETLVTYWPPSHQAAEVQVTALNGGRSPCVRLNALPTWCSELVVQTWWRPAATTSHTRLSRSSTLLKAASAPTIWYGFFLSQLCNLRIFRPGSWTNYRTLPVDRKKVDLMLGVRFGIVS